VGNDELAVAVRLNALVHGLAGLELLSSRTRADHHGRIALVTTFPQPACHDAMTSPSTAAAFARSPADAARGHDLRRCPL
jgi:hypothetical protein